MNKKHFTRTLLKKGGPGFLAALLCLGIILLFQMNDHTSFWGWLFLMTCMVLFCIDLAWFHIAWNRGKTRIQFVQSLPEATFDQIPLNLSALLCLNPTEFEEFVGIVLEAMGTEYTHVRRIGGSGDQGADLYAKNVFDLPVIVQYKRYAFDNHVDSPDMQRFLGSIVHYRAIYGWFVTTSTFTQPALDFAAAHGERIRLLDGEALVALIQQRQQEIAYVWQRRQSQENIEDA